MVVRCLTGVAIGTDPGRRPRWVAPWADLVIALIVPVFTPIPDVAVRPAAVCRTAACAVVKVCLVLSGESRPRWKKAGKTIR